ncbi:hypothetical protein C8R46DRAFT_1106893 [Mycena filopes]|nr:hypothetical protein C8R46DRAFT_1106893 [Mycena filopes]
MDAPGLPVASRTFRVWAASLLLGSWLNTVLFTLQVVLSLFCVRRWAMRRALRGGLLLVVLNDAFGTLAVFVNAYRFVVEGQEFGWPVGVLLVSTSLSALIEQAFMVYRYWKLVRHTAWSTVILLLAVAHTVLTVSAVGLGEPQKTFAIAYGLDMTTVAAIICTVVDVLIALSMVWTLSGIDPVWRSTQHLIRAVCIRALTTGAVVATVTILAMVTLILRSPDRIVFDIFFSIMGRVYSLTILVNFIQQNRQLAAANSLQMTENNLRPSPVSVVVGSLMRASPRLWCRPSITCLLHHPASFADVHETRRTPEVEEEAPSPVGSRDSACGVGSTSGKAPELKGGPTALEVGPVLPACSSVGI